MTQKLRWRLMHTLQRGRIAQSVEQWTENPRVDGSNPSPATISYFILMLTPSKKTIHFIGAGKLGKSLAKDVIDFKLATIISICNSSKVSSQQAIDSLHKDIRYYPIKALPNADIIFITTPDSLIAQCVAQLCQNPNLQKGTMVIHCSGVLNMDVLSPLKKKGCLIGAIHPIRSFSKACQPSLVGAYTGIEGENEAITTIQKLLAPLNLQWLHIDSRHKATYHSASVFAANYLISTLHQAQKSYQEAGIDDEKALQVCVDLAQSVLNNIKQSNSLKKSLTGPLARGDINTIKQHLSPMSPNTKALYQALANNLLKLCEHPPHTEKALSEIL